MDSGKDVIAMVSAISDELAADMTLDAYGPLSPPVGQPLDGEMLTSGKIFWQSDNEVIMTGVWECAAGRMRADFGNDGEMVHVVKGTIRAIPDEGEEFVVSPGESATFPPHWKGEWVLETPMRKLYCTFKFKD
jgi:uncharacterized cupin superfamily protein